MEPGQGDDKSHVPAPSLLPVAFAIGLVIVLVGLIISNWIAVGIGAVIAFAFGGVWIRDLSTSRAEEAEPPPPPSKQVGASTSATTARRRSPRASATRATASSKARPSASAP